MEVSIIIESKVVYSKEFDIKKIKLDHNKITEIQNKFLSFIETDNHAKYLYSIAIGATIAVNNYSYAYAKDMTEITTKIRQSTNPLVEVLAALGYPLTYSMFIIGALMVITGRKSKGLDIIKWAAIGYIGVQFVPFFLGMLEMVGTELRNSLK